MTLVELSDILSNVLLERNSVTLPSMGTFVIEQIPSQIVNEGNTITPPSCRVVFDSSVIGHNESVDVILNKYMALEKVVDGNGSRDGSQLMDEVEKELMTLIKDIKMKLLDASFVEFPGFGVIRFSEESHFVFEPDPQFDPAAEYYGLEPLPLKMVGEVSGEDAVKVSVEEAGDVVVRVDEVQDDMASKVVKRGFPLALSVVLTVVLLMVILVLVVVLFKEELMPLLEKLLYSKEELEFLRENGL
ncbi:MAG: hypothetical protein IKY70_08140 [Bacteroidales bacterium]|nr:hypothetical protein [Bacteroidales bacterium]